MVETMTVNFQDSERGNLKDEFGKKDNGFGMKGRVQIYEHKIGDSEDKLFLLRDTSNLIVYRGRNWLMQRSFNNDLDSRTGWRNYGLTLLGIGTGGAASGNPLVPISPALYNYALNNHGTIGTSVNKVTATSWDTQSSGNATLEFKKFDTGYPKLLYDEDISGEEYLNIYSGCTSIDPETSLSKKCDSFLIAQIQCTLEASEANGAGYLDISEAGLFFTDGISTATETFSSASVAYLFARVTFPTIRKTDDRKIIFKWQIYF